MDLRHKLATLQAQLQVIEEKQYRHTEWDDPICWKPEDCSTCWEYDRASACLEGKIDLIHEILGE